MIYRGVVEFDSNATPKVTVLSNNLDAYNIVASDSGNQVIFTHPCIKHLAYSNASFCVSYDDEMTIFSDCNTGICTVEAIDRNRLDCARYKFNIEIEI